MWFDGADPVAWPSEHTTSIAPSADAVVPGPAATPQALMIDVFDALIAQDRDRLLVHTFDPQELSASARMGSAAATELAAEIEESTLDTLSAFEPRSASQTRPEGLRGLLQPGQLVVGRARDIDGALVDADGEAAMHWGSELTFSLRGTNIEFVLRFPNILRATDGTWRLRTSPRVDQTFTTYRNLGMDLKPELMNVQHAPFPLRVGNYWQYRTRRPGVGAEGESYGVLTNDGYRDLIAEIHTHDGYLVAVLRRVYDNPATASERLAYLVTPLRVYSCSRECVRRSDDPLWTLQYAAREVPLLVFPIVRDSGWGAGGQSVRADVYRVQPEAIEVSIPAGTFADATEIVRSTARGRRSSFFVHGIGYVMRRTESTMESALEELTEYRVLP